MKPYYQDSAVTIYHGDCREILPTLEPVDLVLTDPPYLLKMSGGNKGCLGESMNYIKEIKGFTDNGVDYSFLDRFNNFFCFCSQQQIPELLTIASNKGHAKLLKWMKPNPVPAFYNTYLPDVEYIVHCWQPNRLFGECKDRSTFIVHNCGNRDTIHPNEKPINVIKNLLVKGSVVGDTILDCFMGSGTTLRAAKDLGRKAIGVELEEKYCEISANRMSQEVLAL